MRDVMKRSQAERGGFTLVETILALVIIAMVSAAVMVLITGSAKATAYVNNTTDEVSQVELACRRITHNIRTASALNAPTTTTAGSTLTTVTQQDPNNANATYTVTYTLSAGNLTENDTRFGTSVLVRNVSSFSVTRQTMTAPTTVLVTITVGATPPVTRTFVVMCRNL